MLKKITLFICAVSVGANDITFKNVKLEGTFPSGKYYVSSSNNLKENLPKLASEIEVNVTGSVPVLRDGSVSDIENLKVLDLHYVNLEEIKPSAFRNLPQLRKLILSSNRLRKIEENTFSGLNLTVLDLYFNPISVLQKGAFNNSRIEYLDLTANAMKKISTGFENVEVERLTLSLNQIDEIEVGVFGAMKLKKLDLSYNKLEEIDPEIFNFPDLTHLDLYDNFIKTLRPGDLRNLPKLKELSLGANQITQIPVGVFTGLNLEKLDLSSNKITSISSKSFDNMANLKFVDVAQNELTEWDKNWFYNTSKLETVSFQSSHLQEVPVEALQNLDGLKLLDLKYNKIERFSPNAFIKNGGVVHISEISLIGNKLKCITSDLEEAFLKSVEYLRLKYNTWDEHCKTKTDGIGNQTAFQNWEF